MRRWRARGALSAACTGSPLRPLFRPLRSKLASTRFLAVASTVRPESTPPSAWPTKRPKYTVFEKTAIPERHIDAWVALLNGALPPHLRDWSVQRSPTTLSAQDVAEILLAAQHPQDPAQPAFDLLFHLGFHQQRWSAVVWLIKKLVDRFPVRHARTIELEKVNTLWDGVTNFWETSRAPLNLSLNVGVPSSSSSSSPTSRKTLHQLTNELPPESMTVEERLAHNALGQVWRTLGAMTKACAGGEIKPEVLEIIAFLHHREVMPMSIYRSEPHADDSAIQQPPLLSLLSSRILTSLSDAAWRAHEKLIVEEAKAQGGEYAALRPEIPGTVYRVRIAGLRPEVWMELILWSCIRGGWILPGSDILQSIANDDDWSPLSWEEHEKQIAPDTHIGSPEWSAWEFAFKTRAATTRDAVQSSEVKVELTVSAEVVNAYIDALVSDINVGVGGRGTAVLEVFERVRQLKHFLGKPSHPLTLSTGSWNALVLRVMESQSVVPERDNVPLQNLVSLTHSLGQGSDSTDPQNCVPDEGEAMQGLLHRALLGQIAEGNFEGAKELVHQLQAQAHDTRSVLPTDSPSDSDPLSTMEPEHASLQSQLEDQPVITPIPPTILASLLDLAADSKQWAFGRSILNSQDSGGQVIVDHYLFDPHLQPAIIKFAVGSHSNTLLAKFRGMTLSRDSFRAVLNTQVNAMKLDAASRVLTHLNTHVYTSWEIDTLAYLARGMLLQLGSKERPHLEKAREMFSHMCLGRYEVRSRQGFAVKTPKMIEVRTLLVILSTIDKNWAGLCTGFPVISGHGVFSLPTKCFNIVLDGVLSTKGSVAGRRLLGIFWPHGARRAHDSVFRSAAQDGRMPRYKPELLEGIRRQRIAVKVPQAQGKNDELVLYGALQPNTETILLILRKALQEMEKVTKDATSSVAANRGAKTVASGEDKEILDTTPRGMVEWAVYRLADLRFPGSYIIEDVETVLAELGLHDLRGRLPEILQAARTRVLSQDGQSADARTSDEEAAAAG